MLVVAVAIELVMQWYSSCGVVVYLTVEKLVEVHSWDHGGVVVVVAVEGDGGCVVVVAVEGMVAVWWWLQWRGLVAVWWWWLQW